MTTITKRDGVDAAMSVAEDIASGKIDPAGLEAAATAELTALIDVDPPPGSELAALQLAVARRVLARRVDTIPAAEQAEWLGVARGRETGSGEESPANG
jgi:hypothetical protein